MNTLKKLAMLTSLAVSAVTISAQVFTFNQDPAKLIPDNNPAGTVDSQTISGAGPFPTGFFLKVNLSIQAFAAGTFNAVNGDYYATLAHVDPNNVLDQRLAVLLNRPGRTAANANGYGDNGMTVTLQDFIAPLSSTAAPDIHTYKTVSGFEGQLAPLTGVWAPDGRNGNPGLGTDTDARNNMLSVFNGMDPNGQWVLFVQDASPSGIGKLTSWGLEFTAVPEPHQYALVAGLALIGFALYRRQAIKLA